MKRIKPAPLRRIGLVVVTLSLLLFLSGCWSRYELNELAIVVGLGIDKSDGGYRVSAQIVNPTQVSTHGSASLAPVVTFTQQGKTVPEAIRKMTVQSSKRLYFAHLRILVFGERLAREGIAKPVDFLTREPEMRNDFYLVVARGSTPDEVLKTFSPMDPIPANNLYEKLYNSDNFWAATDLITLDKLTMDLSTRGKSPTLTGIEIRGDKAESKKSTTNQGIGPAAILQYRGMAVFVRDKMVGWLDEDGTKALNYLENSIHQTLAVLNCGENGKLSVAVTDSNTRIRVHRSGDMPIVDAYVRVEANLTDLECDLDLGDEKVMQAVIDGFKEKTVSVLNDGVREAKGLGADVFGFGHEVHQQQPALFHQIPDWNVVFKKMQVNIHADIHMRKIGTIDRSITGQVKE